MFLPIKHVDVNGQYMFTKGDDCVALGEYNDGNFYLVQDEEVDMFPNAMTAFCYLNTKYRRDKDNQLVF